jgi:hypothetical protein
MRKRPEACERLAEGSGGKQSEFAEADWLGLGNACGALGRCREEEEEEEEEARRAVR